MWKPDSWQAYAASQLPDYDPVALAKVQAELVQRANIVTIDRIAACRQALAQTDFILQAGDCAESFTECTKSHVARKTAHIAQLKQQLAAQLNASVLPIARLAGQFAKPRSQAHEIVSGKKLLTYRGDIINSCHPDALARQPDPERMLLAYQHTLEFVQNLPANLNMYFSHEALLLPYEQAMTRYHDDYGWYNASTHLLWLGMRTVTESPAHVEYARGIYNPIALKVGPENSIDKFIDVIRQINPTNEADKLIIIYRYGAAQIESALPLLLARLNEENLVVKLLCDPMHGNTHVTQSGDKIRQVETITEEIRLAVGIHRQFNMPLAGLHLETTADDVIECVDYVEQPKTSNSLLDPRLNPQQTKTVLHCFSQILLETFCVS